MEICMFLKLEEYPDAIASLQQEILKIDTLLETCYFEQSEITHRVDKVIVFDDKYKNDSQRKIARFDLLNIDADYQRILLRISSFVTKRKAAEIHLEKRKNEFSILTLNERRRLYELQQSISE
jgi:hypothetical protein